MPNCEIHRRKKLRSALTETSVKSLEKVYICTAYIDKDGVENIVDELGNEIEYEIVAQYRVDEKRVQPETDADIKYYQVDKHSFVHAKFLILEGADKTENIIGSSNLTGSGFDQNFEMNVQILDGGADGYLMRKFDKVSSRKKLSYTDIQKQEDFKESSREREVQVDKKEKEVIIRPKYASEDLIQEVKYYAEDKEKKNPEKDSSLVSYSINPRVVYERNMDDSDFQKAEKIVNRAFRDIIEELQKEVVVEREDEDVGILLEYVGDKYQRFRDLQEHIKKHEPDGVRFIRKSIETIEEENSSDIMAFRVYKTHYDKDNSIVKRLIRNFEGYGYNIDSRRADEKSEIDIEWNPNRSIELRRYQKKWLEQTCEEDPPDDCEIAAPSGCGKTCFGVKAICEEERRTLVVCPTITVCHQWLNAILNLTNTGKKDIANYYDDNYGDTENIDEDLMITTYKGASESISDLKSEFSLAIFDESHNLRGNKYEKIATEIGLERRLALSATSLNYLRHERNESEVNYEQEFTKVKPNWNDTTEQAVEQGHIEVPEVYGLWSAENEVEADGFQAALEDNKSLNKKLDAIDSVMRRIDEKLDEKVLIFGREIEHVESISRECDADIECIHGGNGEYSMTQKEVNNRIQDYKNGEINGLAMTKVGDEGIDLPNSNIVLMFSWTGNDKVEGTQRLGRIMRSNKGTNPFAIYVLNNNAEKRKMKQQLGHFEKKMGGMTEINYDQNDLVEII